MLEGLEVSEVFYHELLEEYSKFRLDAEYYKKEYIDFSKEIRKKGISKIGDNCFVTDGIHESIDFDNCSEINLISAKSPKENYFDLSSNHYISKEQHLANPRTKLKENDVIVSTVGTIGNCAVVQKNILPANSDRHVGIIRINDNYKPYFLSTFLLTKYGRFQTLRESTGNVQLNLFIYKIKELVIPDLSSLFQQKVHDLCEVAFQNRMQSSKTYTQAENLLLEEVGLQDFEPSTEVVNIKSFSESFGTSGRLDAEYYQPKYDDIEQKIKAQEHNKLETSLLRIDTGEYSPDYYLKDEAIGLTFYIRSTNIKNGQIEIDVNHFVPKDDFKKIARKGDIITARVGSVGVFGEVRESLDGSIYSDNVINFRLPDNFIPSVYTLLFNTKYYFELIDRLARGSVQQRLNQETLKELSIPIIDFNKQQQIADLVEESFVLKQESEHLLEVAKRAVEIAIEEDEEAAMRYIEENTK